MRAESRPWKDQLGLRAERLVPANIYYRAYLTADSHIIVACLNNPTRVKLLSLIGVDDFRMVNGHLITAVDPADDTPERKARLKALVEEAEAVMRTKTTSEWLGIFTKAKIPSGPLRFPEEVFSDEQVAANGYLTQLEHPIAGRYLTATPPVKMSGSPLAIQSTAPLFGEHTRSVLRRAGYSDEEVATLIRSGVVAARD
jgi:formyl-CoA transferase